MVDDDSYLEKDLHLMFWIIQEVNFNIFKSKKTNVDKV